MSELRNELLRARQTYEAARYPGDLASEMLPARRMHLGRWAFAASAVAAVIVVSFIVLRDAPEPANVAAIQSPAAPQPVMISLEMPAMPAMPGDIGFTVPAMPQMPSLDTMLRSNQSHSTTQEAV